jgi:DNA-binding transcriptional ArsR family regulator
LEPAGLEATDRLLKALRDPRVEIFLVLRNAHRPLSRKDLLKVTRLNERTLDRGLRWLRHSELIDKIQDRQGETHYYLLF